jgi:hypothetical protein
LDTPDHTKQKIRRTEVLREIVTAVKASRIDLTNYGTEQELTEAIANRVRG